MRRWIPPSSRCIFCAFTAARPRGSVQLKFRTSFTTSTANSRRFKLGRVDDNDRWRHLSLAGRPSDGALERAFRSAYGQLSYSGYKVEKSTWEDFRSEVYDIAGGHFGELSDFQRALRQDLYKANAEKSLSEFLKYFYIDRVLEDQGHDVKQALSQVADLRYPTEWYIRARSTQRDIHLHIGPTNSGKTYNALKRLEEAGSGFYAGPLRLLAHEVYSRFRAKGRRCDLITGDDIRIDAEGEGSPLQASTVEMVDVNSPVDVGVIDEVQMMADNERGWAWTRAFVGSCAKEVHLCGEKRVLPLVQELVASMGDNLHVHQYERLNELHCMSTSLRGDLRSLRKGDAVVCFSVLGIHEMKKAIEKRTGKRVAIVYGSLPPETRAQQAALFNDPDNEYDYLVASDAIGMGLNLSIKRVIFETVFKYNGVRREQLSVSAIKQIAGRAGRYRTARDAGLQESQLDSRNPKQAKSIGLVTTLMPADLPIVQAALDTEAAPITTASIMPPGEFVEEFAARLPADTPHEYVLRRMAEAAAVHPRFTLSDLSDQCFVARIIEPVRGLTTTQRHVFTAAPFSFRRDNREGGNMLALEMAQAISDKRVVTIVDLKQLPLELLEVPLKDERTLLNQLEFLHQGLVLFLWLSYRMPTTFKGRHMAIHAKDMVEARINTFLESFTSTKAVGGMAGTEHVNASAGDSHMSSDGDGVIADAEESPTADTNNHDAALPIDWHRQSPSGLESTTQQGDRRPSEQATGKD